METNDLCRRLRYALQLDDADTSRLMGLGGLVASPADAAAWRAQETDDNYLACPSEALSALLSGLVLDRRGPPPADQPSKGSSDAEINNNTILKGIKTALSLRTEEVRDCIVAGGGSVSNSEVGSLLRRPDARNFRGCGDQMLRRFLSGLAQRQRPAPNTPDQATDTPS